MIYKELKIKDAIISYHKANDKGVIIEESEEVFCDVLFGLLDDCLVIASRSKDKKFGIAIRFPKDLSCEIANAINNIGMSGETKQ